MNFELYLKFIVMKLMYLKLNQDWNQHFLGYSALAIVLSTCLGAGAILTTVQQGMGLLVGAQIFLVVSFCSALNASILTVQKPKVVLNTLLISVLVSVLVMLFGFLIL